MIDKLEMLIALSRERHFGRAAEACHVTQPTLSSAIKALEESLGTQLVLRGARFIGLTPEGERVLTRAKAIVAEARAMRSDVLTARDGVTGTLRLGVIPTALASVHDLTRPFLTENPGARLRVLSLPTCRTSTRRGSRFCRFMTRPTPWSPSPPPICRQPWAGRNWTGSSCRC